MAELQPFIVFHGGHKRDIHTDTHITIAVGEMQRIAFRLKSKHCDDLAINGFESGFKEGNAFYIGYIHFF